MLASLPCRYMVAVARAKGMRLLLASALKEELCNICALCVVLCNSCNIPQCNSVLWGGIKEVAYRKVMQLTWNQWNELTSLVG